MNRLFSRLPTLPLSIGTVIGLALGLTYTWAISPVELVNTYPALLRTDHRLDWIRLTALSYTADQDLERARTRLEGLEQQDVTRVLETLIEEYASTGHPAAHLRSLTTLAQALNVHTPAMLIYLETPAPFVPTIPSPSPSPSPSSSPTSHPTSPPTATSTPSPTLTPTPSITPLLSTLTPESRRPTDTPSPTPTPPLLSRIELAEQTLLCEPGISPHIQVIVRDEQGAGLPGVEVWLTWPGGADRAITGIKPQGGAGYVDFDAERGVSYAIGIGELGLPLVTDLQLTPCPTEDDTDNNHPTTGSWQIILQPPPTD